MKKRIHKFLLILFVFIMTLNSTGYASDNSLSLVGESALLVDYNSNRVLYEKDSHKRMFPASTTKIMTAILAIESGKMDDMVEIDAEVVGLTDGSHIALDYNEKVKFEDLLNALMIASANDSAYALAKHVSGSIEGFVELMNDKAAEIGAVDTHFVNPNGLHDDNHYTTAYDLFLIAKYAMENDTFREFASKAQYTIPPTNKKTEARILHTTNKFLYGFDKMDVNGKIMPIKNPSIKGIKTGTTSNAQSCLVSYTEKDGRPMIAVVLKSQRIPVYSDSYKLFEYGYNNYHSISLGHANEFVENLAIENGSLPYASTVLSKDVSYILKNDEKDKVEKALKFKDDIDLPIAIGDVLGSAEFYLDGDLIAKEDIVSTIEILEVQQNGFVKMIFNKWTLLILVLLVIVRTFFLMKKKKRKRRSSSRYI